MKKTAKTTCGFGTNGCKNPSRYYDKQQKSAQKTQQISEKNRVLLKQKRSFEKYNKKYEKRLIKKMKKQKRHKFN